MSAPRTRRPKAPPTDPAAAAHEAHLAYVSDDRPGIRRLRTGRGFRYVDTHDRPVRDPATLRRIRSLALPPAWAGVWICPQPHGHLQATGRDARGRKQYRYHTRWRSVRDATKYDRMTAFGQALPALRARTAEHLALPGLPREKVLATVVCLLEVTLIRVGNEEYARENHSYGLTTLRDRHVDIDGSTVRFHFRGKSGVRHELEVSDARLAKVVKRCQDVPGQELFQYRDAATGEFRTVSSGDVNDYLREVTGQEFTAKDFRTWAGTVLAAKALREFPLAKTATVAKRNVVRAIEAVAARLGNTAAVCRKCYVNPAVIDAYLEGTLAATLARRAEDELKRNLPDLPPEEAAVLAFLDARLKQAAAG
jgi:DNA topoisomerase-1